MSALSGISGESLYRFAWMCANPYTAEEPQVTECGEWEGCKVQAITDAMGPQVVLTGARELLSPCQKNHAAAVDLANRLVAGEVVIDDKWESKP